MNGPKNILQNQLFTPAQTAAEIRELFRPFAAEKKLLFECNADNETARLQLKGDDRKLIQIISQLVHNAIKFTDKGFVNVKLEHVDAGDSTINLVVHVKDSGPGISEDEQKLFQPFRFGGFGLAMSKRLAQQLGGVLIVNSEPGLGTEFELTVPFQSGTREEKISPRTEPEKKKILVVDDDEMSMLLMSNILKKHSIPHAQASGGKEALSKLQTSNYDMVLTDINMPGFSGKDLLQQLRSASGPARTIPVVAVTSGKKNTENEDYESIGFSKVLFKPFREEDLIKTIYQNLNIDQSSIKERPCSAVLHTKKQNTFRIDELNRISNSSYEFVQMMLEKFITISADNTEKMLSALVSGDRETVMQLAHKSIPSYHMLGLTGMAEQLKCIERNIRDGKDLSESSVLVRMVHEHTREVINDIRTYLKKLKENELIK